MNLHLLTQLTQYSKQQIGMKERYDAHVLGKITVLVHELTQSLKSALSLALAQFTMYSQFFLKQTPFGLSPGGHNPCREFSIIIQVIILLLLLCADQ